MLSAGKKVCLLPWSKERLCEPAKAASLADRSHLPVGKPGLNF